MINVTLFEKSNFLIGFELSGHAGYAEYGNDIVCAAISVLAINTVNSIDAFTDDLFDYTVGEEDGLLNFKLISNNISEKSELLLNAFKLGILSIQQQYGKTYIDIKIEEV